MSTFTGFAAPLLGPYLERRVADLIPAWSAAVILEQNNDSGEAIRRALGTPEQVLRRPDGKPEVNGSGWHVSASHCGDLVIAVACKTQIACDVEEIVERSQDLWRNLLGAEAFALAELIATRSSVNFDNAATRVWTARECLTKAGAPPGSPLVLERCSANGAVLLTSGSRRIATFEVEPIRIFAFLACEPTNFATL